MSRKTFLLNAFDLLVLSCLAIAQPVFSLLAKNGEFLTARKSDAAEIFILIAFTTSVPPLAMIILEFIARMVSVKLCGFVHRVLVWVLLVLLFLPPSKPLHQGLDDLQFVMVMLFAAILSETYYRLRSKGLALAYASPVILILPGLFIFHSPVKSLVHFGKDPVRQYAKVKAETTPIVMVVFDEFPLTSLVNTHGRINSLRHPNFAGLAETSTWYRNASAVSAATLYSIPAIANGLYPDPSKPKLPFARDYPDTIFTLLGGSYKMNVFENVTSLCPEDLGGSANMPRSRLERAKSLFSDVAVLYLYILLPSEWTTSLPNITQSWKEFSVSRSRLQLHDPGDLFRVASWSERSQVFANFVESLRPDSVPTLNFLHILLPHAPWEYLPSGRRHSLSEGDIRGLIGIKDKGVEIQKWLDDSWAIRQAHKKHLLQVEMVDSLLGKMIDHLKKEGLFEPALIVITSDHGACFRANTSRRVPTRDNYPDLMAIPLFIKAPNQHRGVIDDSNIESVDILPTIADILGIKVPWRTDGRSALDRSITSRENKTIVLDNAQKMVVGPDLSGIYRTISEKMETFGYSAEDLFRIGPFRQLIGQDLKNLSIAKSSVKCTLDQNASLKDVDLNAHFIPANIKGKLTSGDSGLRLPLSVAIAVNGRIAGTTEAYEDSGKTVRFSLVLPESSFQQGYNQVRVYLVSRPGGSMQLAETEMAEIPHYRWGDVISFGSAGTAKWYTTAGWNFPEEGITWTSGNQAELILPTSTPRGSLSLRLHSGAYLKPGILDRQRIRLYVNRQAVAEWTVTSRNFEVKEVKIPKKFLDSDRTIIALEMPDATAPSRIGDGKDARQLGLAVSSISLSESQED